LKDNSDPQENIRNYQRRDSDITSKEQINFWLDNLTEAVRLKTL
jgi:hypothetical protein